MPSHLEIFRIMKEKYCTEVMVRCCRFVKDHRRISRFQQAREAIHTEKQNGALNRDVGQLNVIYNVLLNKRDERRRNNARG